MPGSPCGWRGVQARNDGRENSDEEFLIRLNQIYQEKGLSTQFRRATAEEYEWAETEGGQKRRSMNDPDFGEYVTYEGISDKAPLDLSQPSPSGEHQTHGVNAKRANNFGFYRSGVWEWTENMSDWGDRVLVGGSWDYYPECAASGYRISRWADYQSYRVGPARLVRTE